MPKKLTVTQIYGKKIVDAIEAENPFGKVLVASRLLEQFFLDRLDELESQVDEVIAGDPPAKDVAEAKARSDKKNMKVPVTN
jgi:hypothetical protein